ncbi:hypothetical protein [Nocardia sp. NPDC049707]|uniref:hypothetical protein n=1 Tax=Nocardia sp. NPDC049707 TaxID=3154735 RepID=UPI0034169AD2
MTEKPADLGRAAEALLDSSSHAYAELDPSEIREGIVGLLAAQESAYLEYDMLEIDLALVRALLLETADLDVRLLEWLTEQPSTARLGVTCRALWQLWSPANPHPPIDPATVQRLIAAAEQVDIGTNEAGPYHAALEFAAHQVDDPATLAAIDHEVVHLATADPE